MSNTKFQHVFLAPLTSKVAHPPVKAKERIAFCGKDRERAEQENVPADGWIQFRRATAPADGEVPMMICTCGYDGTGVAADVTGFISDHDVNIDAGFATTMMEEYQGEVFVFGVDVTAFQRMEQDLPTFEEVMNQRFQAKQRSQQQTPVQRIDVTIILKDRPKAFHKAAKIMAKHNVNIRSMMGGPYKPVVPRGSRRPAPNDLAAITMQVDVPIDGAEQVLAAIRRDMEAQPGWFFAMKEHGKSTRQAGWVEADDRAGNQRPAPKADAGSEANANADAETADSGYTVSVDHFGP